MPLNKGRQTHIEVPSSNEPLPSEWGKPMWYMCRLAALQAKTDITDDDARRLINYFESLLFLIPCVECRGHYSAYWHATPFGDEQAHNTEKAMFWVEELRRDVDARIAEERRVASANTYRTPGVAIRRYAIQNAVQVSQMNHTGRKIGCNCGKKAKRT